MSGFLNVRCILAFLFGRLPNLLIQHLDQIFFGYVLDFLRETQQFCSNQIQRTIDLCVLHDACALFSSTILVNAE